MDLRREMKYMLKIKGAVLFFFLIVVLTACSKEAKTTDALYMDTLSSREEVVYKTTKVTIGDFAKQDTYDGKAYFPITKQLAFDTKNTSAVFLKYLVRTKDKVKKGTPLANFSVEYDEVALGEKELQLKIAQKDYEKNLKSFQTAITELEKNLYMITNYTEREINELKLQKLKIQYKEYILSTEDNLNKQKKELDEYKSNLSVTQLIAPMDGIISELVDKKEGDNVSTNETLVTMYSTDSLDIQVTDNNGVIRYNMDVAIEVGKHPVSIKGRVTSCPYILPDGLNNGIIHIKPLEIPDRVNWNSEINVNIDSIRMENVLLVDKKAVLTDARGTYVIILENGSLHKRYFVSGANNTDKYWVLQGLEEGQAVIIN